MRRYLTWAVVPLAALIIIALACHENGKPALSPDLASDLKLVTAATDLELASLRLDPPSVVSPLERVDQPSRRVTPTPSRKSGTKAPPPDVVAVDDAATEAVATAVDVVAATPATDESARTSSPEPESTPEAPRPAAEDPTIPGGGGSTDGRGNDGRGVLDGIIIIVSGGRDRGGIWGPVIETRRPTDPTGGGVVIRGGRTRRDPCAIHMPVPVALPGGVLINDRTPRRTFPSPGTFPVR